MISDEPGTVEPGTYEPATDEPGTDEPGTDEPDTEPPGYSYESSEEGSGSEEGNAMNCNDWCHPKSKPNDYIMCEPIKHMIAMKQEGKAIRIPNGRSGRAWKLILSCEHCKFCQFSDVCTKCPKKVEVPEDSSEGSGE